MSATVKQVARVLPSPLGDNHELHVKKGPDGSSCMPSTLNAEINILQETKMLRSDEPQEFWISVEIGGMIHNRRQLSDPNIDVVFIIDNGQCLPT